MNNLEIILEEAIAAGLYTKEEAEKIIESEGCLPLHTYSHWRQDYGMAVKKGEHAIITTRLWKYRQKKKKEDEAEKKEEDNSSDYYKAKAFLFSREQVEPIKEV